MIMMMMMIRSHHPYYHPGYTCYFEELAPDAALDALLPEVDEEAAAAILKFLV
jgi:hypothetical protein